MAAMNIDRDKVPASFRSLLISDGVRSMAVRQPSKAALMHDGQVRTYGQFIKRINQLINAAADDLGLVAGDHVAILSENCFEFMEIMVGIGDLGVAAATPSPKLSQAEITAILKDCQAKVVFTQKDLEHLIDRDALPLMERVVNFGDEYDSWLERASSRYRRPVATEWSTFSIPYTSGTTGKPKGVLVPHRSRTLNIFGMAVEYGCYGADHHFLNTTPMCHGAGFTFLYANLFCGGTAEFIKKYDPEQVLDILHKSKVTGFFLVPTQFHKMFDLPDDILDRYRDLSLETIISNAAPLPQPTKERIIDYFGDGLLFECYGSTEAGIVTNLRPEDQLRKQSCVGHPFAGTYVKLLNERGEEVGPGEVGELFATGPALFNGYWNRPQETQEAFRDEWVTVGDLAVKDEEGYLFIVDRKKDMLISGGINIYPREIEEVVAAHPAVSETAVIGVDDPEWGEKVVAFVVTRASAAVSEEEIKLFVGDKLAKYKIPKTVHFISELPRNPSGKTLKRELKALA